MAEDGDQGLPPPPPPSNPSTKISPYVQNLRSAPPSYLSQPPKPVDHSLNLAPTGIYFFYGTLSDPALLAEILDLNGEPVFRPACVRGFECKLWGQYPALLSGSGPGSASGSSSGSVVEGAAYHVQTVQHAERLAEYETRSYRAEPCVIKYADVEEPREERGFVFVFVGDRREISEGKFDLRVWLRRMGRGGAVERLDEKRVGGGGGGGTG